MKSDINRVQSIEKKVLKSFQHFIGFIQLKSKCVRTKAHCFMSICFARVHTLTYTQANLSTSVIGVIQ